MDGDKTGNEIRCIVEKKQNEQVSKIVPYRQ